MSLISLLMTMLMTGILLAGSVVSVTQTAAIKNQQAAQVRISEIVNDISMTNFCSVPANNCNPGVFSAAIPAVNTVQTIGSYKYLLTQNGSFWVLTASPISMLRGGFAFFVDQSLVMRCTAGVGPATVTSPICN